MDASHAKTGMLSERLSDFALATQAAASRPATANEIWIDAISTLEEHSGRAPSKIASKKIFDFSLALLLILFLGPLLIIISMLIKLDGGSVLFGHTRVGENGKLFRCWKFRSMVPNAADVLAQVLATDPEARAEWARDFKLRNDPRVTRVGRFLRKTSLDELPQLFNVLCGEMSLVGPRPIVSAEVDRYGAAFLDYVACRPGITGLWQVSGRNDVDYASRVALDRQYVRSWSFLSDMRILFKTPLVVVRRSGAY